MKQLKKFGPNSSIFNIYLIYGFTVRNYFCSRWRFWNL